MARVLPPSRREMSEADKEAEHAELQRRLGDVLAWIRQRELRDERVSDELFHLVHRIEFRVGIALLQNERDVQLVTDEHSYAAH